MNRIDQLKEMISQEPQDPFLHYALGLELMGQKNYSDAAERFEQLKENHPDYLALYYQLGKCYEEQDLIDEALEAYRKGEHLADAQKDMKTLGELREAIWYLED